VLDPKRIVADGYDQIAERHAAWASHTGSRYPSCGLSRDGSRRRLSKLPGMNAALPTECAITSRSAPRR
jgi:hypothetical protein